MHLRFFISSPGDVAHERRIARAVFKRLDAEFAGVVELDPYFWEYEPFDFSKSFQQQIANPSDFDVVLCFLWSRLGSPLHSSTTLPDGSPARSGTEYEITQALEGQRRCGFPELHVWINQSRPVIPIDPRQEREQRLAQYDALKDFIIDWTRDYKEQAFIGSFTDYQTLAEFEDLLEVKLRKVIERRAEAEGSTRAEAGREAAPPVTWTGGSPFRGLETFEFEHAQVFFGRTKAVGEALDAVRRNLVDPKDPRGFLLILGASGSGKSSLARAGLLPTLVEPGVLDGVGIWRRGVLRPSEASGDLFASLAGALLAETALKELADDGTTIASLAGRLTENPAVVAEAISGGLRQVAKECCLAQQEALRQLAGQREAEGRATDAEAARKTAENLRPSPARLALLVDQLEELFTGSASEEILEAFLKALAALARSGRVVVVTTLRSDFFPRLVDYPVLAELAAGTGSYHLPSPSTHEFGQIIRKPAVAAGLRWEEHRDSGETLDRELARTAEKEPAVLPLLEFALDQLYEQRNANGLLIWTAYEQIGGIEGALAKTAENALESLSSQGRAYFEAVFGKLATISPGAEQVPTRRTANFDELTAGRKGEALEGAVTLVEAFVQRRLLTTSLDAQGRKIIAISHEALLRSWDRLRALIDSNCDALRIRARVEQSLARWIENGQHVSLLLQPGLPLAEAQKLIKEAPQFSTSAIENFVTRSANHWRAIEDRRRRLRRIVFASLSVLGLLVLIGIALVVIKQSEASKLQRQREAYYSVHQGDQLLAGSDPHSALLLYKAAYEGNPDFTTRSALLRALQRVSPHLWCNFYEHHAPVTALSFGPDGHLLSGDSEGEVRLLNIAEITCQRKIDPPEPNMAGSDHTTSLRDVEGLQWLPDGKSARVLYRDGELRNIASGPEQSSPTLGRLSVQVKAAAFSPDARWLGASETEAAESYCISLEESRVPEGDLREHAEVISTRGRITAFAFGTDGKEFAYGTEHGGVYLRDKSGSEVALRPDNGVPVTSVALRSAGDGLLAVGNADGVLEVYSSADQMLIARLQRHPGPVKGLAWRPEHNELATSCEDGRIRIFTVVQSSNNSLPTLVLDGHKGPALVVAWSADGTWLASGGDDKIVKIWCLDRHEGPFGALDQAGEPLHGLAVSADGKWVAAGCENGDICVWSWPDRKLQARLRGHRATVNALAWHPSQPILASGDKNGKLLFWNWPEQEPSSLIDAKGQEHRHDDAVWSLAWFSNGEELASAGLDGKVRIWNRTTLRSKIVGSMPDNALGLAISPDDRWLASSSARGEIWLWKVGVQEASPGRAADRTLPRSGQEGHAESVCALNFNGEGTLLASCGNDGTVRVWEVKTAAQRGSSPPGGSYLEDVAISKNGSFLATIGADGNLQVWTFPSLEPVLSVPAHQVHGWNVAWLDGGRTLASTSDDGTVQLFETDERAWGKRLNRVLGIPIKSPDSGSR
jgi:WD40 repeat protein